MKNNAFILLVYLALISFSCSSDDDNSNSSEDANLEGTWKLTEWNTETPFDLDNDGTASQNMLDEVNCLTNETITFNADNSAEVNSTSFLDIEIYLETGTTDSFSFDVDCESDVFSFDLTWSQNGDEVILTEVGFEDEEIVAILDGDTLTLILDDELDVYDEEFNFEFSESITVVYTKQ